MFKLDPDETLKYVKPEKTISKKVATTPIKIGFDVPPVKETIVKPEMDKVYYNGKDLNDIVHTIISCLIHISEKRYYGATMLIDVLRGSDSERINKAGFKNIQEYGKLKSVVSREVLSLIVEWLIENHFILQTRGQYPVLHPTNEALNYSDNITVAKLKKLLSYIEN